MRKLTLFLFLFLLPLAVFAQNKPTADAAKAFLDFYYTGQGQGVVLADAKVCTEVSREGDNRYECVDTVDLNALQAGETYNLWMLFVVPEGDTYEDILVQFNQGGLTRQTKEVSVSGSLRYRTWKSLRLTKVGDWTIKVLHARGDAVEELASLSVTVVE